MGIYQAYQMDFSRVRAARRQWARGYAPNDALATEIGNLLATIERMREMGATPPRNIDRTAANLLDEMKSLIAN